MLSQMADKSSIYNAVCPLNNNDFPAPKEDTPQESPPLRWQVSP